MDTDKYVTQARREILDLTGGSTIKVHHMVIQLAVALKTGSGYASMSMTGVDEVREIAAHAQRKRMREDRLPYKGADGNWHNIKMPANIVLGEE